jgi:capsular exopolysaccharide synthesis family protein
MDEHNQQGPANGDAESRLPAPRPPAPQPLSLTHQPQGLSTVLAGGEARVEEEGIDLMSYWHAILKHKWKVLGLVVVGLAWSTVHTLLTPKTFRASTTVQISTGQVQVVDVGDVDAGRFDGSYLETQQELIRSRALAQRVVSELGLVESGDYKRMQPDSAWDRLLAILGAEKAAVEPEQMTPNQVERVERGLVGWFAGGVSVAPVGYSELARINYDSPDPRFSVKAVNAVAQAYVASNLERKFDSSAYAKTYLEDSLQELKVKLEDSERELVKFAQAEQIVGVGEDLSAGTLTEQDLLAANSALSSARAERLKAETRWRQAQASTGSVVAGMIDSDTLIQRLQEQRGELQSEYQNKLARFKPAYPAMQELKGQIDELDRQIAAEVNAIKVAIKAEYDAAVAQEATLTNMLSGLKADVLDLQSRSIRYNILKREVDTNRQLYDGLLQRYKEIGVAAGVSANNLSVIDKAESAYQIAPNMRRNVSLGLMLGLVAGVLLALLLEYLDDTIRTPLDIEAKLRLVNLGIVPKLGREDTPAKAQADLRSPFSEAYRSIRTALQFSTDSGIPTTLVVTSTTPGEGKSTTAIALARNFAQLGKRVLLIDGDLRNPSVHKNFSVSNTSGLSNCLAGASKPGECIQRIEAENLSLLTSGPLPPNPAELLASPRMLSLIAQAAERFDHVVIDAPPVVGLADALILANLAKGTIVVVESGRARVAAVQASIKRLGSARARILGAVLTKFDARKEGLGYGKSGYGNLSYEYYAYGSEPRKRLGSNS